VDTLANGILTLLPALQGKEMNFAHNALYAISATAYYGTSQKLLGRTPEFKDYIPEAAIVLVAAGVLRSMLLDSALLTCYR
jgi:hypothetical protein